MMARRVADNIETVFHYCLLGIFLFTSISFFFIFVINWEVWFFGIKLDGFPAGMLLFTKFMITIILAFLLVKYPEKIVIIAGMSLFFFGFSCIDSAVTIQKNTSGQEFFATLPAILILVPATILISHFLAARSWKRDDDSTRSAPITGSAFSTTVSKKTVRYATGDMLMLALAGVVVAVLVGPVIISLFFSPQNAGISSSGYSGDSLISKVDANGTTEWQTLVHGYSDFPLQVSQSNDGDFIIGGMFRLSGQTDASLRVMKFGSNGTLIWNIQRGVFAYPETNLGALHAVLPTAGEYTVIMVDGFVIRLDAQGNELWHHRNPNTFVQSSLSLPDGGYIIIGEAHEGRPSEPGWKIFDGWILDANRQGDTVWEKKEKEFSNCRKALLSPEGDLLVSCSVSDLDPDKAGNQIVALDLQGNYLWKKSFAEKKDGILYAMKSPGNGTLEVYLRGEGERRYLLDRQGNVIDEELLSSRPDSFSHEIEPDITYNAEPVAVNRTRITVKNLYGSETVFLIDYPVNREGLSRIYSVNPISDGGYLLFSSAQ
jgi:hypothetical protein